MTTGPNVPRGTNPTKAQEQALGLAFPQLCQYVQILGQEAVLQGLLGPREIDRIWDRHILNCAALNELIPQAKSIIDIGSGAGLPGIVLAIMNPSTHVILVEPMQRRTDFLNDVKKQLNLENVEIIRGRAENQKIQAQVVTSRAVAPLNKLLAWSLPLVEKGGKVLAIKGEKAQSELEEAQKELNLLKNTTASIKTCGLALDLSVTVVEISKE
ncbi:MAG: 16S rRNA (guanine(527)-N(7))-methyltransferase RsmG [Candidatus Nanopelagicales bacterium]|nr:16S rRNA (guanine(527)-N(7))-methyltransferase RsmG [Candidatus Nanopelagicales bacterium]MDP4986070.1 16S rRNA (guanine(527)-N(7))-methyltransferase RsmG [Candidatus Nanopelagicales bacterium]